MTQSQREGNRGSFILIKPIFTFKKKHSHVIKVVYIINIVYMKTYYM